MKLWTPRGKRAPLTVQEGDILCLPIDDSFVAAKVLWVSQRHLNAMGIAVYAHRFAAPIMSLDSLTGYARFKLGRDDAPILYPSVENVTKKKIWSVIGHRPLDDADRKLRRHIIGGSLYDGDDEIRRPATLDDHGFYPRMMAAPAPVVLNLIRAAMDQLPAAKEQGEGRMEPPTPNPQRSVMMLDAKWKFLILSVIAYQALLTWCLFDLVDTAAYLARTECGERCSDRLFGFILTNQGGSDTAMLFATLGGVLVLANVAVWIVSAVRRKKRMKA